MGGMRGQAAIFFALIASVIAVIFFFALGVTVKYGPKPEKKMISKEDVHELPRSVVASQPFLEMETEDGGMRDSIRKSIAGESVEDIESKLYDYSDGNLFSCVDLKLNEDHQRFCSLCDPESRDVCVEFGEEYKALVAFPMGKTVEVKISMPEV